MLEIQIKDLTAAVIALTEKVEKLDASFVAAMSLLGEAARPQEQPVEAPAKKTRIKKEPTPEPTPGPTPGPTPESTPEPTPEPTQVSLDDLQRFCLELVRENRSLRDKIKETIKTVGGANLITDVPQSKAAELKLALEGLKNA